MLKNANGQVIADSKKTKQRWKEYVEIINSRNVNVQDILEDITQPFSTRRWS